MRQCLPSLGVGLRARDVLQFMTWPKGFQNLGFQVDGLGRGLRFMASVSRSVRCLRFGARGSGFKA